MHHTVLNVYVWGEQEQSRLLVNCLEPAVRDAWAANSLVRFWFHRFDARGPHVMVLLGEPAEQAGEIRKRLRKRLEAYLATSPSTVQIEPHVLEERHAACRGRALCSLDARSGLGANNSYLFVDDHACDAYLFRRAVGMDSDVVNHLLGGLAFWSVAQLRRGRGGGSAAGLVAALSRTLDQAYAGSEDLWRYYASTLLPGLSDQILGRDQRMLEALPGLIGSRNRAVLDSVWEATKPGSPLWPGETRLAELVAAAQPLTTENRRAFVRELLHSMLSQLGLATRVRTSLILYAWLRTLPQFAQS